MNLSEKHQEFCTHTPPATIYNAEEKLYPMKFENVNTKLNETQYTGNKRQNLGKLKETTQTLFFFIGFSSNLFHLLREKENTNGLFWVTVLLKKNNQNYLEGSLFSENC